LLKSWLAALRAGDVEELMLAAIAAEAERLLAADVLTGCGMRTSPATWPAGPPRQNSPSRAYLKTETRVFIAGDGPRSKPSPPRETGKFQQ
jgi:hypothetical protein